MGCSGSKAANGVETPQAVDKVASSKPKETGGDKKEAKPVDPAVHSDDKKEEGNEPGTPEPAENPDSSNAVIIEDKDGNKTDLNALFPENPFKGCEKNYRDFPTDRAGLDAEFAKGIYGVHPFVDTKELQPGIKYTGQYEGPMIQGFGMLEIVGKTTYTGHFKANKYEGLGVAIQADGSECYGEFKAGAADGYAVYKFANGDYHYGLWADNKRNGWGKFVAENGDVVYCDYKNGGRIGFGRAFFADGSTYAGEFKGCDIEGFGIYTWPNGRVYKGTWKLSQQEGEKCEMVYPDGRKYIGPFFQGVAKGHGTIWYANGSSYIGAFENNRPHGVGFVFDTAGSKREAHMIEGDRAKWLGEDIPVECQDEFVPIGLPDTMKDLDLEVGSVTNNLDDFILNNAKTTGGLDKLLGQDAIEAY